MIRNNKLANGEGIMEPADVEKSANGEGLADIEKPVSVDIEKAVLVDVEKPVVICYKYQYWY